MKRKTSHARANGLTPLFAATALLLAGPAASASAAVVISPLSGSIAATPQTQISFLGAPIADLNHVSVVGSVSGHHSGSLRAYGGVVGASFLPAKPFKAGERVTVTARAKAVKLSSRFTIATPVRLTVRPFPAAPGKPGDVQSFHSRPDLHPPTFTVTTPAAAGAFPGDLLTTPSLGPGQHGPMILDSAGRLVWTMPEPAGVSATDLRQQVYQGKPVLTWWEGKVLSAGFGRGTDVVLGTDYRPVAHVLAGNGLGADLHEFVITPQNTALISAYNPIRADLSSLKGPRRAIVLDGIVQEVDIATGLVVWEWHSTGNVPFSDSYAPPPAPKLAKVPFDYFHVNSAFRYANGDILISARNTSAVYLLNRATGHIRWRLGGKRSSFKLGPGVRFAFQHDAEGQPDGNISVFDDEAAPPVRPPSKGKLIHINFASKTATIVKRFVAKPPLLTFSQGSVQALTNGDWLVGWGGLPNITEFNSAGQVIFDGHFPKKENSYRAFISPWAGQPLDQPKLAIVPGPPGAGTAYVSWNGATQVASWRLLSGPSAATLVAGAPVPRTGFETAIPLPAGTSAAQVQALDGAGHVLGTSGINS